MYEGRADYQLTEQGENQAQKMADHVQEHFPPDIILANTLRRASRTAEILQKVIRCEICYFDELREFDNGVLGGLSRNEAAVKYPLPKGGRPAHIPIQDGESALQLRYRAEGIFQQIVHDFKETERIAIVSHGGMISNFLGAFLNLPFQSKYQFHTGDTGIHLLELKEDICAVKFMNSLEHLSKGDTHC